MLVDAAKEGDVEIPYFCYEPKLGPAGRRLPHVPGGDRGDPEAADLVLHAGARRHGGEHHLRPREARAERGGRVPAREPPARLPGVRQGRRVPAPGHLVRLGRRALALHRAEAPLQEAARAVAARGDRPRALHPLLPLRAVLAGGGRGPPARVPRPRRPHLRGHPPRAPVRGAVQREHHRAVPGGRAHLAARTGSARGRGTSRARARSARSAPRSATWSSPSATTRRSSGCSRATTRRWTTAGCATRAASATSRSAPRSGSPRRWPAIGGFLRETTWERALSDAAALLEKSGASTVARVGGQATNEEGFLVQHLMRSALGAQDIAVERARRGARSPAHAAPSRARSRAWICRPGSRTSITPTRSSCWTPSSWTRRRSSTCACARPSGATARGSWSPRAGRRRSTAPPPPPSASRPAPRRPPSARWRPRSAPPRAGGSLDDLAAQRPRVRGLHPRPHERAAAQAAADAVRAVAQIVRDAGDVVIIWGERVIAWRAGRPGRPGAARGGRRARHRRQARSPA